jgi:hypothetical protein
VNKAMKAMYPLPSLFPNSPAALELHRIWKEIRTGAMERKGSGVVLNLE